jgi:hypothetical protein
MHEGQELGILAALGFAENLIGDVRSDGDAEAFTLVGLDHQENPQNKADEMNEVPEPVAKREARPATSDEAKTEEITENFAENAESTENHDGLGSVEADGRALVNEEEYKAGNPAKSVAEGAGNIFLETRLRARCGRTRILSRLSRTAGRTKRNVFSDGRSAFRAVWHGTPPWELRLNLLAAKPSKTRLQQQA